MVGGPHCDGCVQNPRGERLVCTDGLGTSGVLVVGDSPWVEEVRVGRPFVGAAGALLDRIISRLGMERESFLLTNSMWCKPPHLGWTDHPERYEDAALALNHCRIYLDELIEEFKPRAIVPMGNVALQRVCGVSGIDNRHGYVHDTVYGIPAIPTYHPSFVLKGNQRYVPVVAFALRRAQELLERPKCALLLDPPPDAARDYLERCVGQEVACDIETPESPRLDEEAADAEASWNIIRIGFSSSPYTGLTLPWAEPYKRLVKGYLPQFSAVVFWNSSYDAPRLRQAGCQLPAQLYDAMWAWHFLQSDLPKKLGFVAPFYYQGPPWKHLSDAEPAYYNAMDALATFLCWQGIRRDLEKQGRWDIFLRHCVELAPVLTRMEDAGVLVDQEARQRFKEMLEREYAEAYQELQERVPPAVRPERIYKKPPKGRADVRPVQVPCTCQREVTID